MLDRADDDVTAVEALQIPGQGQVVRLGATAGEHDLAIVGADRRRDLGARIFDRRTRLPPGGVDLGRRCRRVR